MEIRKEQTHFLVQTGRFFELNQVLFESESNIRNDIIKHVLNVKITILSKSE